MKQLIVLFFTVTIAINSFSQKGIDGLITVEKKFAALSVTNGMKDAFMANMDTNSIVFDKRTPVNGITTWQAQQKGKEVLNWSPAYAEISGSGDFGYTTGPWTFRPESTDSIIATGYYTTVWHINQAGEWKFIVDLGVDETPVTNKKQLVKIAASKTAVALADTADFIKTEKEFIRLSGYNSKEAYNKYLSTQSILHREGKLPATAIDQQKDRLSHTPAIITYTISRWIISPSRDMACVYGSSDVNRMRDNYLRIWRHEKNGWKIALEVLQPSVDHS